LYFVFTQKREQLERGFSTPFIVFRLHPEKREQLEREFSTPFQLNKYFQALKRSLV
jgi:hypothetical protein